MLKTSPTRVPIVALRSVSRLRLCDLHFWLVPFIFDPNELSMKGFVRQAVWVLGRFSFARPPSIRKEKAFIKYIYQSSGLRSRENFDLLSLINRKWLLRMWRWAKPGAADLSSFHPSLISLSLSFGGCGSVSNGGWLFWLIVVGWFWLKVVG